MKKISLIVFVSFIYSVVRYVAFTPEKWEQIPVFIANKGISMAGAITVVLAIPSRYRGNFEQASLYFRFTIFAIFMHVPMSLVVLNPGYFPEFFTASGGKLKFFGELVFLFGALGLGLVWLLAQGKLADRARTIVGVALIVILLGHVGSMGICRGLNIDAKHAYLPPMWLLSLVALLIGRKGQSVHRCKNPSANSVAPGYYVPEPAPLAWRHCGIGWTPNQKRGISIAG